MAEKYVTLMIISQPTAKVSTLRFRRKTLITLAVLVVCVLGFSCFLGVSYTGQRIREADLRSLEERNQILSEELTSLQGSLAQYKSQMKENVALEEQLRLTANLEPIPPEARLMGVGGSQRYSTAHMQALTHRERTDVTRMTERVDQLVRQAGLTRESLGEVQEALAADRVKWACIPSIRPVDTGFYSSGFGRRTDPFTGRIAMHWGLDICTWKGEPVYATADGTVIKAKSDGSFGKLVVIDHGNGYITRYGHNSELKVKKGRKVRRGDVIALVGQSGRATAPHLHYEVRVNGKPVDPMSYILSGDHIVD